MAIISVLMNVYNVEAYVAEALASIQSQTIQDIEVLVADDGSTDRTRSIVESMAATDPRIKIVGTASNQGIAQALNLGLRFCSAPLIAKMDGDDIALPTRLEKQLRFLEENPGIALVGCFVAALFGADPLAAWVDASVAGGTVVQQAADAWLGHLEWRLSGFRQLRADLFDKLG